ncbi:MAG TPA: Hint domain-containing protein [Kofleriaceae bacterium]|nr:Hint domain-containing protein [Kofleriaceae bacterium]
MNTFKLVMIAALAAAPTSALAQSVQVVRCQTVDNIDIPTGLNRIEWARKCGLTQNTGALPHTGNPANFFQSTKAANASTLQGANDYLENTTAAGYSNSVNDFNVNYTRAWSKFGSFFAYTVFQDTSGPTLNYYNWTTTLGTRAQPYYPSFDTTVSGTGTALFPPPNANINSPCTLFTDPNGVTPYTGANYFVAFYCAAGCYTADQQVAFGKGDEKIIDAYTELRNDVVTLAPDATLDDPRTQVSPVLSYTRDAREGNQVIYIVTTQSGGQLKVTNSHPVMVSDGVSGKLVMAEKLHVGDELVKADGTPDAVASIEKQNYFGRAYNLQPVTTDHVQNILIAQGYLVGSLRFQNDDLNYMNRALLFRAVPTEVVPK